MNTLSQVDELFELLSLEQLRALPEKGDGGLYFLWDQDDGLIYIGKSKNLANRLRPGQRKIAYCRHTCLAIDYRTMGWIYGPLEAKYIAKYSPHYNVMHTAEWNAARKWA